MPRLFRILHQLKNFLSLKEDEIKADAKDYGEEVKYVSHELISDDNWEGFEVVYSFNDITKIKIQPDPGSKVGMGDEEGETTADEEYYFFKFKKGRFQS